MNTQPFTHCLMCGKALEKPTMKQKYCTVGCKIAAYVKSARARGWKRTNIVKTCLGCGKEFHPAHNHNRYCSRACGVANRTGKSAPNQTPVVCRWCGKVFTVRRSTIKHAKFCSLNCRNEDQRISSLGENNPNFRNAGQKVCVGCGKNYQSYQPTQKFCSMRCSQRLCKSYGMINGKHGIDAERKCVRLLTQWGFHCSRSQASKGLFDVVAVRNNMVLFIQVKRTSEKSRMFQKKDVEKLAVAATPNATFIRKELWCLLDGVGWSVMYIPPTMIGCGSAIKALINPVRPDDLPYAPLMNNQQQKPTTYE